MSTVTVLVIFVISVVIENNIWIAIISQIQEAKTKEAIIAIYNKMEDKAFLSFQFNKDIFNEHITIPTSFKLSLVNIVIEAYYNDYQKFGYPLITEKIWRNIFYKNPKLIVGKKITVKYFEKTKNSLRFPIFIGIRNYE